MYLFLLYNHFPRWVVRSLIEKAHFVHIKSVLSYFVAAAQDIIGIILLFFSNKEHSNLCIFILHVLIMLLYIYHTYYLNLQSQEQPLGKSIKCLRLFKIVFRMVYFSYAFQDDLPQVGCLSQPKASVGQTLASSWSAPAIYWLVCCFIVCHCLLLLLKTQRNIDQNMANRGHKVATNNSILIFLYERYSTMKQRWIKLYFFKTVPAEFRFFICQTTLSH